MDGTEDDALYEDFLGECVAETENVMDNDGYADYYDDSLATCEIPDYDLASFLWMKTMIPILRNFNPINPIYHK